MKCFYHPDRDAVALCKSCNRGLCRDCGVEVPPGLACRARCEADVAALNLAIQRGRTIYQKTGDAYRRNAVARLIVGVFFVALGFLSVLASQGYLAVFLVPFGCIFLLWSFFHWHSGTQISEVESRDKM